MEVEVADPGFLRAFPEPPRPIRLLFALGVGRDERASCACLVLELDQGAFRTLVQVNRPDSRLATHARCSVTEVDVGPLQRQLLALPHSCVESEIEFGLALRTIAPNHLTKPLLLVLEQIADPARTFPETFHGDQRICVEPADADRPGEDRGNQTAVAVQSRASQSCASRAAWDRAISAEVEEQI